MHRFLAAVAASCTLAFAASVEAQTVDLAASGDNTMFEEVPGFSNGAGDFFFAGTTDGGDSRRGLIEFDPSSIPAGSTITLVTLSLYMSRAKSNASFGVSLHRASAAWGEGTSHASGEEGTGAPATTGDATWSHRIWMSSAWSTPGGAYASTASATTGVDRDGRRYSWSSPGMVSDVQGWLDAPSSNRGWAIIGDETAARSAKRFDSRQSSDAGRRPILTVSYTGPAASGACCAPSGSCSVETNATCAGSYRGDSTSCASVSCPLPSGACCAADGSCAVASAGACAGSYEGDGTSCSPNPCPVPTGACCASDGSCGLVSDPGTSCGGTYLGPATSCSPNPCMAVTGACCAADGGCSIVVHPGGSCIGAYEGRDSLCSPNPCPQPTGACCAMDGSCASVTGAACSGTWLGASMTCSPAPCPQPTGACCAADGGCSVATDASCGGSWMGASASCSPNPCPLPNGACCSVDGSCASTTNAACAGDWRGDSVSCSPNPCPLPTGACCAPDATCSVETSGSCSGDFQGVGTSCAMLSCPLSLTPFVDPLPRPAVATPTVGMSGGAADYQIAIVQIEQQLHRDLPATTVWGYDDGTTGGTYPGPTIEARRDEAVRVTWINDLRDASGSPRTDHYLPVDHCPHGAATSDPRTVMHLHGGHVAEASDGYPENALLPGSMAVYDYPNWQESAQIWYHDHALGITRLNVYMGLAGLYTVRDSIEDALDLPAGDDEVPLVIQDRSFGPDGSLVYPAEWQEHFFGDTILVNGKVWPFHEVARGKVRFRLLNGSNSRVYELYLSDGATMTVIGGDGGFLDAPIDVDEVTLAPGERADVVIDFEGYAAGTEVLLLNRAPAPYPGVPGVGVVPNVVKLVVADRVGHTAPLPGTLRTLDRLDEADAVLTRDFELRRGPDDCGGRAWYINDLRWDDLTEMPALGTTEVWRFVNRSGHIHPMHMHLVFFQVLDRQPFEIVGDTINPLGSPLPPEPHETGPKDTVLVGPNEIVRVIARFEDFVGRFAYHCHVLEHEDHEMMRQFLTTTTCGDGARGLPDEECDDGNTLDGDGCSATCALESGVDSGPMPDGGSPDGSSPDGSSPDGGDGGAEPGPNDGGCGCRVPRRGGSGLAPWWAFSAVALFLSLLRRTSRRRRRKLSIAGRSVQ